MACIIHDKLLCIVCFPPVKYLLSSAHDIVHVSQQSLLLVHVITQSGITREHVNAIEMGSHDGLHLNRTPVSSSIQSLDPVGRSLIAPLTSRLLAHHCPLPGPQVRQAPSGHD